MRIKVARGAGCDARPVMSLGGGFSVALTAVLRSPRQLRDVHARGDDPDPMSSPMKAKGMGELGLCGVAAAVANAITNATGVRERNYPITLDKLLDRMPEGA